MAIHLKETTKVLVQGFTGQIGSFHSHRAQSPNVKHSCGNLCSKLNALKRVMTLLEQGNEFAIFLDVERMCTA